MSTPESDSVQFWEERNHFILGALVEAGGLPSIDPIEYRREFDRAVAEGIPETYACHVAIERIKARPTPSACEVHPW